MSALPTSTHSCRHRFKRPSNILVAEPQITCNLLSLPPELIVDILNKCEHLDRMCLALTCKRLLHVSSLVRIRIPSVPKHRFLPPSTCVDIFTLLRRIAPRDNSGRPEANIGLCCDCLRYRTRRIQYWDGYEDKYLEMGVEPEMWDNAVSHWHSKYYFQCPECWCRETFRLS
ncbi:F-box domain, cyclin-like [Penicillium roqueforti FM164]|uniref:F-box domain, cyclin-like n=1 Tax=Penicillium roqueforti (strain FM164) TaxID=1365484 RepID=W6Q165_PENRF|nr:F-box domain, cyclin-like [Penicillium roqueforti FM164]